MLARVAIAFALISIVPLASGMDVPTAVAAAKKGKGKGKGKAKPKPKPKKTPDELAAEKAMELGGAAFEEGRYEEALGHFGRARDLLPDLSGPYRAIAYTELKLGNLSATKVAFQNYIDIKGSGPAVEAARAELAKVEELIAEKEAAEAAARAVEARDRVDLSAAPVPVGTDPDKKKKGGGPGGVRIAGFAGAGVGAVAIGVGVVFLVQWLGTRADFKNAYDPVRGDLTLLDGSETRLRICSDNDFAMFSAESQMLLMPARDLCGKLATRRVLAPVMLGVGGVILAAGLSLALLGGKKDSKSGDPYALGPVRLSFDLLPGGAMVGATTTF